LCKLGRRTAYGGSDRASADRQHEQFLDSRAEHDDDEPCSGAVHNATDAKLAFDSTDNSVAVHAANRHSDDARTSSGNAAGRHDSADCSTNTGHARRSAMRSQHNAGRIQFDSSGGTESIRLGQRLGINHAPGYRFDAFRVGCSGAAMRSWTDARRKQCASAQ
jgi:hypothetical protein